jgi:hypothetical protein
MLPGENREVESMIQWGRFIDGIGGVILVFAETQESLPLPS